MFPLDLSRALSVCALGAAIAVATGCGGSGSGYGDDAPTAPASPPPSTAAGPTVQATTQNAFTPREVAIGTGATVTWAFGSVAHNVTFAPAAGAVSGGEYGATGGSAGGSPSNVPTTSNASVPRTFSAAGSYSYECTIHPGMAGTVIVR